ncbi:MAG: EVE domain-containing protein [Fimbriimonadales bacterium]|nr:EVE domain-containing protein [Fimbriimonadales bacterium]
MRHWLMKSEPSVYSIADLRREVRAMWEGCRNYLVRNRLRDEVRPGDMAFFYHSNSQPSGIAGIMEVVSEAYPDPTQFDPESPYFDPKATRENPRWLAVDVEFVREFARVVPLAELKEHPVLGGMEVCRRGQRLSVLPVTTDEWDAVLALPGV